MPPKANAMRSVCAALLLALLAACAGRLEAAPPANTPRASVLPISIVPYPQRLVRAPGEFVSRTPIAPRCEESLAGGSGGYEIAVHASGIRMRAHDDAGCFYARQTLAQLTVRRNRAYAVPAVQVLDSPRYAWRGIHLDLARRYFSVATIERLISLEARYKLNILHLHLTDDQAWRLPSTAYAQLPSAQHYSRAQLREIVRFASQRYVTIVPEIDLPAHSSAAIRAYPQLACRRSDELCPGAAARFADTVLREAATIFPGPYVHVGGDETQSWNAAELRAFEAHVAHTLSELHRRAVAWDDQGSTAPDQTLLTVWHAGDAAAFAAARNHDVVMVPDGPLYFDAAQGDRAQEPAATPYVSTIEEVYAYDPAVRAGGIEAAEWTERIAGEHALWYSLLPRALALGEIAWTLPAHKDWHRFYAALPAQLAWLQRHGYGARIPNPIFGLADARARYASVAGNIDGAIAYVDGKSVTVRIDEAMPQSAIWYRTGNSSSWHRYRKPFRVSAGITVLAYAKTSRAQSAQSMLRTRERATPAGSRSFDAIVSP